jgi:hypothetical protein
VRGLPTYSTSADLLLKAAGAGLLVAIGVAILWAFAPAWKFYLALLLGFGVAEAMAKASRNKRGVDLMVVGSVCITIGLILSRVFIAQRVGITWEMANDLNAIVLEKFPSTVQDVLQLRVIPDGVFAALAYLIVWVRFR